MNTALSRDRDIDTRPFIPSDIPIGRTLIRGMTACAVAAARQRHPSHASVIAREVWERDRVTPALLTRKNWSGKLKGSSGIIFAPLPETSTT
jgi:hypothetical protein